MTSVAIHEAGHAVASRELCGGETRAWLGPDGSGGVEGGTTERPRSRDELRRTLSVVMAGPASELLEAGKDILDERRIVDIARGLLHRERISGQDSLQWARERLATLVGAQPDDLAVWHELDHLATDALRRTVKLLRQHWPAVQFVAGRLEARGETVI